MKGITPNLVANTTDDELRIIVCDHLDSRPATSSTIQWRLGATTLRDKQRLNEALALMVRDKQIGHFSAGNKTYFATKPWLDRICACCESIADPREKVLSG